MDEEGRVVGVVTPFTNWLQPNEQFIKQKANLSRLRDYKPNYQADRSTTERHLAEKQPVQTSQTQFRHQK